MVFGPKEFKVVLAPAGQTTEVACHRLLNALANDEQQVADRLGELLVVDLVDGLAVPALEFRLRNPLRAAAAGEVTALRDKNPTCLAAREAAIRGCVRSQTEVSIDPLLITWPLRQLRFAAKRRPFAERQREARRASRQRVFIARGGDGAPLEKYFDERSPRPHKAGLRGRR